jgi:hypothetical protein
VVVDGDGGAVGGEELAVAAPMPRLAPVTRTMRFFSMGGLLWEWLARR